MRRTMARDRDLENAPAGGQSKRPPLTHRDSGSHSDTTNNSAAAPPHHHRPKQHQRGPHAVGRLHGRVPSSKAIHKSHAHPHVSHAPATKANQRRPASPAGADETPQHHRRVTSEVKLPRQASAANLPKTLSHTSLRRNRSQAEVNKRTRSSDKLRRNSGGSSTHRSTKSSKTQVHFDLGSDDPEDEWVDASGSNSPQVSRKGSLNSSAHSSVRQGGAAENHRPSSLSNVQAQARQPPSPDRATAQHNEYLTSRLLQRTPSHAAPTKMTADPANAAPAQSIRSFGPTPSRSPTHISGSNPDGLVSRFVDGSGSGLTSQGSFYQPADPSTRQRLGDLPAEPSAMAILNQSHKKVELAPMTPLDVDISALVPDPAGRTTAPSAEASRTQQKLNLQRASSVLEPGQGLNGVGGVIGATPLIGVGGPGNDGANSRDPRIGRLLERTGMEYLVVRRYQQPVERSLNRLGRLPGIDKSLRIPSRSGHGGLVNGKRRTGSADGDIRHARNTSMPEPDRAVRNGGSMRVNGTESSFERDEMGRLQERLSGVSLNGMEEEDGIHALLRNLWEKPLDLSASTD